MRLPSLRKRGLELAPGLILRTSEQPNGSWAAWIEQDGAPLEISVSMPRLFEGPTRYQAQCEAMRWIRADGSCAEMRSRIREHELRGRTTTVVRTQAAVG